jgi:N6-adenosine-specific RNA methylase IME4
LEEGLNLMRQWGFKQVEDICWLQTNKGSSATASRSGGSVDPNTVLQRTHEHCLMGLRGEPYMLRDRDLASCTPDERMRLQLVQFIHAGSAVDVFVADAPSSKDSSAKPTQLYDIIESYCMGRRRLELFGSEHNVRRGWLTLGSSIPEVLDNFDINRFKAQFEVVPLREAVAADAEGDDGSGGGGGGAGAGGTSAEWITAPAVPSLAARNAYQKRLEHDKVHGRYDARLEHYLPFRRDIDAKRARSPPPREGTRGPPSSRSQQMQPRRVWNDGITAGFIALEQQLIAEGKQPPQRRSAVANNHNNNVSPPQQSHYSRAFQQQQQQQQQGGYGHTQPAGGGASAAPPIRPIRSLSPQPLFQ